ncbi:hypothetical protein DL546_005742 [Coniochaeta pulveracea]|uniref:AB hydrolase-1 domain-containing protein n=1 Tax=Coniochaeta pulveracea TaxID=177199 RepID=A0A420Y838_9PEZI|nr:hypothetical protein DL546_005742 [Coniochaeta pulveracea]
MSRVLSYSPKKPSTAAGTRHVLLYFISGNPGLIDYYSPFLSTLHTLLESSSTSLRQRERPPVVIHIRGRDLAGFADNDHNEPFTPSNPPHTLEYQIRYILSDIAATMVQAEGPRNGTPFDAVVIMGHSVGTFISLEIFNRHLHGEIAEVNLRAGILLFPTVTHLAKSPAGKRLDFIRGTPFLDSNAHRIAKGFVDFVPTTALRYILRRVMGFPEHAAEVTLNFLRSRDGIWQAIHMGKDELKVIGEETWKDELWEIAEETDKEGSEVPKFYMYYGQGDHWVANECRDEFIARRNDHAQREGKRAKTKIVVDEDNIPHAFCLSKFFLSVCRSEMVSGTRC